MLTTVFSPEVLIVLAGGFQIFGYLLINQTYLRLTILCGTCLYIAYYYTVGDTPLWTAITLSGLTIVAILAGLAGLYARNSKLMLPKEHADIYPHFSDMLPGDFRKLVLTASRTTVEEQTRITHEGDQPGNLYFVIDGTFDVMKGDAHFVVPGPTFVGEVAYLTDGTSAATTTLLAGTEVLIWSTAVLKAKSRRLPRFKLALEAAISQDLAKKVSFAISPDAKRISE